MADLINEKITSGQIIDGRITCGLIEAELKARSFEGRYVIDGFPRNMNNFWAWYDVLGPFTDVNRVIFLETSEEVMLDRILKRGKTSGRTDDNVETAMKRFETFK